MDTRNLASRYGLPEMSWDAVSTRLEAGFAVGPDGGGPDRHTCWLTTTDADGSPHVNALGAVWGEGCFWFVTGLATRRGRNLTRDPRCAMALSVREFDLVVEGVAERVEDPEVVARTAQRYATEEGWPCEVDASGVALTAPFSAPSAGGPPWHLFRLDARAAHAVLAVEPGGATRWRF
ncbi:pyridoxamine 5'-phosphate oxidase family protein [Desertihabitans brevis]|uniref:Pyridoxamine 5'-phosphate oxidase family protein n=1 Tax=Desertihabitans brevis TaxID=2268447 RepID=A0A367YYC0_9ACTN|nr:pyridoxamine 5'-phosphate oxidase family protein [Desertihabitans brevis]RCK69941.1 pyridoxamine 5'-phosphate oxidase family protein [Desertihabitans brevis]